MPHQVNALFQELGCGQGLEVAGEARLPSRGLDGSASVGMGFGRPAGPTLDLCTNKSYTSWLGEGEKVWGDEAALWILEGALRSSHWT